LCQCQAEEGVANEGFIAVIGLVLSAYGLGYNNGRNNESKKPPQPRKLSGYFLAIYWATVYR